MIAIEDIPLGSALSILGENDQGEEETWYGQLNGKEHQKMEVALLTPQSKGTYVFETGGYTPQYFEVSCLQQYEPIEPMESMKAHKQAWRRLGLRLISSSKGDLFIDIDREEETGVVPLGEEDSDEESYCSEDESSLDGFIVKEDEEPFTPASPTHNDWVEETHQAVHDFNHWTPASTKEKEVKNFIHRLEMKYSHQDDNTHFLKGQAPPAYTQPPLRKKTRRS